MILTAILAVTIIITNNGFEPKELTIQQGEKIEFANQSNFQAWPASNIHPTHRIYPEFDIKRPLNPRQNWIFQFDRAGEWLYHDHLRPELGGKIKVVGNETKNMKRENWFLNTEVLIKRIYYFFWPARFGEDL